MICRDVVELVTDYADGALPEAERAAIDAHLRGCGGCAAYLEQLQVVVRSLGRLPPEPPDEPTREALRRAFRGRSSR